MTDGIGLAILFLILALVAFVLGAKGIAGFSMTIAQVSVIIFIILAIISFFLEWHPKFFFPSRVHFPEGHRFSRKRTIPSMDAPHLVTKGYAHQSIP